MSSPYPGIRHRHMQPSFYTHHPLPSTLMFLSSFQSLTHFTLPYWPTLNKCNVLVSLLARCMNIAAAQKRASAATLYERSIHFYLAATDSPVLLHSFMYLCSPFEWHPQIAESAVISKLSPHHHLIAETQLIISYMNQLRSKRSANLNRAELALMRRPNTQTIYLGHCLPNSGKKEMSL